MGILGLDNMTLVKFIVFSIPIIACLILSSQFWWLPVKRLLQLSTLLVVNIIVMLMLYYVKFYHPSRREAERPSQNLFLSNTTSPPNAQFYRVRDEDVYLSTLQNKLSQWNSSSNRELLATNVSAKVNITPFHSFSVPPPTQSAAAESESNAHLLLSLYPFPSDRCRQLVNSMIQSLCKDYLLPTHEARGWDTATLKDIEKYVTLVIYRLVLKLSAIDWTQFIGFVAVREFHQHCRSFKSMNDAVKNPYLFQDNASERKFVSNLSARLVDALVQPSIARCLLARQFCIDICSDIVLLGSLNQLCQPANIHYWLHTFLVQRSKKSATERRHTPFRNYEELYAVIKETDNVEELNDLLKQINKEINRLQVLQIFHQQKKSNTKESAPSFPGSSILRSIFPSISTSEWSAATSSISSTDPVSSRNPSSITKSSTSTTPSTPKSRINMASLDRYLNQLRNCKKLIALRLYQEEKKLRGSERVPVSWFLQGSSSTVPPCNKTARSSYKDRKETSDESDTSSNEEFEGLESVNSHTTGMTEQYRKSASLPVKKSSSKTKFSGASLLPPNIFRKVRTYMGNASEANSATADKTHREKRDKENAASTLPTSSSSSMKAMFKRAMSAQSKPRKKEKEEFGRLSTKKPVLLPFNDILASEDGRDALKRFLKQSQDSVLVEFVQMIDSLVESQEYERLFLGRQIWQTYIKCSRPVFDFSSDILCSMKEFLQGNESLHGFQAARNKVAEHLESCHYGRFILSSFYPILCQKLLAVALQKHEAQLPEDEDEELTVSYLSSSFTRAHTIQEVDFLEENDPEIAIAEGDHPFISSTITSEQEVVLRSKPSTEISDRPILASSFTENPIMLTTMCEAIPGLDDPDNAVFSEYERKSSTSSNMHDEDPVTHVKQPAWQCPDLKDDDVFFLKLKQELEQKIARKENALKALHATAAIATTKNKDQIEAEIVQVNTDLDALREKANELVHHLARVHQWWDYRGWWRARVSSIYRSRGLIRVSKESIHLDIVVVHVSDSNKRWKISHTLQELYDLKNALLEIYPFLKPAMSVPSARRVFFLLSLKLDKADKMAATRELGLIIDRFFTFVLTHAQLQLCEKVFDFFCTSALTYFHDSISTRPHVASYQKRLQSTGNLRAPRKRTATNSRLVVKKSNENGVSTSGKVRKGIPAYRRASLVHSNSSSHGHHLYPQHRSYSLSSSSISNLHSASTAHRRNRSHRHVSVSSPTVDVAKASFLFHSPPSGTKRNHRNQEDRVPENHTVSTKAAPSPDVSTKEAEKSPSGVPSSSFNPLNPDTTTAFAGSELSSDGNMDPSLIDKFKLQMQRLKSAPMNLGATFFLDDVDSAQSVDGVASTSTSNDILLIPLLELFEELCQQRTPFNFPRRSLMQIAQTFFADSWSRDLAGAIDNLLCEGTLYSGLQWLANSYFPSAASRPSPVDPKLAEPLDTSQVPGNAPELAAKQDLTKRLLWATIPDLMKKLLGQSNLADGIGFLYELLHCQLANKALLFRILDALVRQISAQEPGL